MCACGTHAIAHLVMHTHQIAKKWFMHHFSHISSVMHVCPSHVTQSHVTHSATCSIVWFCQDSPTRCPEGVPGMVEQS